MYVCSIMTYKMYPDKVRIYIYSYLGKIIISDWLWENPPCSRILHSLTK